MLWGGWPWRDWAASWHPILSHFCWPAPKIDATQCGTDLILNPGPGAHSDLQPVTHSTFPQTSLTHLSAGGEWGSACSRLATNLLSLPGVRIEVGKGSQVWAKLLRAGRCASWHVWRLGHQVPSRPLFLFLPPSELWVETKRGGDLNWDLFFFKVRVCFFIW